MLVESRFRFVEFAAADEILNDCYRNPHRDLAAFRLEPLW